MPTLAEPAVWAARIRSQVLSLPQVATWPALVEIFERPTAATQGFLTWEYPRLACSAVGGTAEEALPAMAAVACLQAGVHLVDDLLDEEPGGLHHRLGVGRTANLALALQASAQQALARAELPPAAHAAALAAVAQAAFETAWGQELDAQGPEELGEAAYWRAVDAKTPPLLGQALVLGALLGGAAPRAATAFGGLGRSLGRLVQVSDDVRDALAKPAATDWQTRWNNLPILYASLVEHVDRRRFRELAERVEDPAALDEAQRILVSCGALSYAFYQVVESFQGGRRTLDELAPTNREPLEVLLETLIKPTQDLFTDLGIELPISR